jgi:chemotaxis protein CheX
MADISEIEIRVFIEAVTNYFDHLTGEPAIIRSAYLADVVLPRFDYTGLITLSGQFRGCVYFSATKQMTTKLLHTLREPNLSNANLLDIVGEVANTIAGNARKHFGAELEISTPLTVFGHADAIKPAVRARPFAIDLTWQKCAAVVVIDLEALRPATS